MGKGRRPNSITTNGYDITEPIHSFKTLYEKFKISPHIQKAIQESRYKSPTAVQAQIIPLMLERREIVCSAPTGSGKTLAFVLPILHQLKQPKSIGSFRAVILAPTRELAKQIHREALRISYGTKIRIHHLKDIKEAAKKFCPDSLLKYDILITTPNRLAMLLNGDPPSIMLDKLEWLVLDECDRLFELGFKDDLSVIYRHSLLSENCRRAMFSATFDSHLEVWAQVQMNNLATVIVGGKNRTAPNVEQELIYVGNDQGKILSLREVILSGVNVPVLIFVETKDKAKLLAEEFMYDNLQIDYINSDRSPGDRDDVVRRFRNGSIWFLVCTDLMGRGIDFKGVNLVINYDCPKSFVSYVHRVGRTGRAGRGGKSITFVADEDVKFLKPILATMRKSGCTIPDSVAKLIKKK